MIRRSLLLATLCCAASIAQAAGQDASAQAQTQAPAAAVPAPAAEVANPLVKIDNVVGTGREATAGNKVVVHYTGWFYKPLALKQHGRKFDSSVDRGEPLDFQLGAGRVIKGWDQGVAGMKVGGKRTLIIPSELAYGKRGAGGGSIPADSDLIFDVELLDVK
jgi:FKBP-type peptidyl-prolyl cis-trans isomerase FkpA